ncbi:SIS domain-containing protein [Nocardioides campestrisoli]|uniref:SIS domain-containing protein n=1 Tax=Nocardioides campestrisoli TaxID=2736757 RepID=UPI0015E7945C|nr:SIS domain-containing protein [Nocardioides campestrisoli]
MTASTRMAHEIAEGPHALERTLADLLPLRAELRARAAGRRRVLFAARGTSDNAAVYGRYLLETQAGIGTALAAPSVATHYAVAQDLSDALVVSVSQSGATREIVDYQEWARTQGAATVAVTNVAGSELAERADVALVTGAGPEVAVPATKTYLAQLAAMGVLASALSPDPVVLEEPLLRSVGEVSRLLAERRGVSELAAALAEAATVVVSGRGVVLGTALEIALKLEETCLRPVRGYSYADLRHGPVSVVGDDTTAVLVSAPDGPFAPAMAQLAADLRGRGARVLGIGGDDAFAAACDLVVPGPRLPEAVAPLGLVVPAQLAVEESARLLGLDPDAPRSLAKVTQTD